MKKKGRKGYLFVLLVVLLVVGGLVAANAQRLGVVPPAAPVYDTVAVKRSTISQQVGQSGTLQSRQSAVLAWKTTGKVAAVQVQIGEPVKTGQVLASLDASSLSPAVLQAQGDLITAEQDLKKLRESNSARAQAQTNLANAQKTVEDALQKAELLQQPNASPANIDLAQGNYDLAVVQVNQNEAIYSLFENRPEDDPQRLLAAAQLEKAYRLREVALWNLNFAKNKPDPLQASRTEARLAVAQAVLKDAETEWARVKNGPTTDDLAAAEARIETARSALVLQTLTAPFDGTIQQINSYSGDLVKAGSPAFRLEDLSELFINVGVPEVDINRIKIGQATSIVFDAIPSHSYLGRVSQIGNVGTSHQGMIDYQVLIQVLDADELVKPGITGAVNITVNSVEDVLIIPNRAIRQSGSQRVVYILRDSKAVMVPIQPGISDELETQVISGDVQVGDLVILNPPSAKTPQK